MCISAFHVKNLRLSSNKRKSVANIMCVKSCAGYHFYSSASPYCSTPMFVLDQYIGPSSIILLLSKLIFLSNEY